MIASVLFIIAGIFLISLAINLERLKVPNYIKQSIPKKAWSVMLNIVAIFLSISFAFSLFCLFIAGILNGMVGYISFLYTVERLRKGD
jgi:sulfite exporter TauE/SafE